MYLKLLAIGMVAIFIAQITARSVNKIAAEGNIETNEINEKHDLNYSNRTIKQEGEQPNLENETELETFLAKTYDPEISAQFKAQQTAEWNYVTDIKDETFQELMKVTEATAKLQKDYYEKYFKNLNPDKYTKEENKRQVTKLKILGDGALPETELKQLTEIRSKMTEIYSTAKICPYTKPDCDLNTEGLSLDPGITDALAQSKDYDEQVYLWKEWRNQSGKKIKQHFKTYVELSNKMASANGFANLGEMWKNAYETKDFEKTLEELWNKVKPLYEELHTYVRRKLKRTYGNKIDISDKKIPAHVFGNMWAQSWVNIADLVRPYPEASKIDITAALVEQKYTPKKMFETSDDFYKSLNLPKNDMSYGDKAMITKPDNREVLCHASAWDFYDGKDFRIKMCTKVQSEDFITIHHEMGHIQYYLQYSTQPVTFKEGANPGFHEAIGDTIALSVDTPRHLKKINLLELSYEETEESTINELMDMALKRVAFLPFGYLIDKWRWDVFKGDVEEKDWNNHWWKLRQEIQNVKPPVERTAEDFDAGAKFHVAGDSQYINYFIAHILEFQLYKSLCKAADQYDPSKPELALHKCDFYQSTKAGELLTKGLSLGSSKIWTEALKAMTGESDLSADALLEYFEPLYKFLKNENLKEDDKLRELLKKYDAEASVETNKQVKASWKYATDINEENQNALIKATQELADFKKKYYDEEFSKLEPNEIVDESLKRQLKKILVLGEAKLDKTDLEKLTKIKTKMSQIYSSAKVCPYNKQDCDLNTEGLNLDPGITNALANSKDYEEQLYLWKQWREKTGKQMKTFYGTYVEFSNKMARANDFKNKAEYWQSAYETENFASEVEALWNNVQPLYESLHTYVQRRLKLMYGDKIDTEDGKIPAHVFGNMWAQSWENLAKILRPFPRASSVDVTAALQEQNYNVKKMFETSDEFYTSLGLDKNDMSYGENAMIEKPEGKEVVCHASAWDFSDKKDFRIKMCTKVNYEDFITVHHEMGHIQYYIQYKDQQITFRGGANPGFHEAVGDTIAFSVATPKHLKKIKLVSEDYEESYEATINSLMDMALQRVAFLPFGYLIDKWRWDVFAGLKEEDWNKRWWEYRQKYQLIKPPIERETADFDPGAKYHVAGDSQYINYFIAHILEFQLYRSLCKEAGEYDPNDPKKPLHNCDFYESTKVGDKLRTGLKLGSSQHWTKALKEMTGEEKLSSDAILEYFKPLKDFLDKDNEKPFLENEVRLFLQDDYLLKAPAILNAQAKAEWKYATDIKTENLNELTKVTKETALFQKTYHDEYFDRLDPTQYQDETIKRQLAKLKVIGDAKLSETDLEEYTKVKNAMLEIYSTAKICPFDNQKCDLASQGLNLDPEITTALATSDNYDEQVYLWKEWRSKTGKGMKEHFKKYVELSNKMAVANGFKNKGELWKSAYETNNFEAEMQVLWDKVKVLYEYLHSYVTKKLKKVYGTKLDISDGTLPASVFGNMWAQSWINMGHLVKPYPNAASLNVTKALEDNKFTVKQMFETSNNFYTSLGLPSNEVSYGKDAMIEKPNDREVVCHASAWDFYDNNDFRIKMCTKVNYEDFITVHHEMGHIQYFIQYKDQPVTLKDGANPGFHEAIGDTIALSVATTTHLKKIGLLSADFEESKETSINTLMDMALERVAFLPFGYLIDKWRWDVFDGLPEKDWNSKWWEYRKTIQKIKPPVTREPDDFDPASKYHVAGDSQYINYFIAHILEFQLYRSLCIEAGQYDPQKKDVPLHKCDFYESKKAGEKLRAGLQLGASRHWKEVLKEMTGEDDLDATALLEYFEPLYEFLKEEDKESIDEASSNTVAIVVGSIVGVLCVGGIGFYLYKRFKK